MFNLVRSVTLYAPKALKSAHKCCISLFPAVFTLENSWVYVCSSYSCNIFSDIKTSVNKTLGFCATLGILYIYPDDSYVQFQRHFDDLWFKHKKDIRWRDNFISYYNKFTVIIVDEISQDIRLNVLESLVNVRNMFSRRQYKI